MDVSYVPRGTLNASQGELTIQSSIDITEGQSESYVKLDDTVPLNKNTDLRLVHRDFITKIRELGLSDISDPDNQNIIKIADSLLHRASRLAARHRQEYTTLETENITLKKSKNALQDEVDKLKTINSDLHREIADLHAKLARAYTSATPQACKSKAVDELLPKI